jgi:hypothetical protein
MARRDKLTTPAKGNKSKVVEQQVVQVTDGKHKGRVGQVSASKRGGWNEVILSDNEEKINIRATMFRPVRMSAAGEAKGLEREAPIQEELQHEDTTEKKERNRGGRKEETGGSAVKAGSPPMQHTATPPVDEARPSRLEELMRRALNGSSSALSSRSIPPQLNRAGQFGSARLHSGLEAPSTAAGRAKQSILHAAPNLVREGGSALPLRRRPRADIGATLVSHASDPAAARDAAIVKMRNFIDPKRFYKAPDIMSATFQVSSWSLTILDIFSAELSGPATIPFSLSLSLSLSGWNSACRLF